METFFFSLSWFNKVVFFGLIDFASSNSVIHFFAEFFARFGIVVSLLSIIYLVAKDRVHALFTAVLSVVMSMLIFAFIYLAKSSNEAIVFTYEASKISTTYSNLCLPQTQIFLSLSMAIALLLRGHKKLGSFLIVLSLLISIGRISTGYSFPSSAMVSLVIGAIAGILAYWFMEHFEDFWATHSA